MAALMTRRHFTVIAASILNLRGVISEKDRKEVAKRFANDLKATNGRFDERRFLGACEV